MSDFMSDFSTDELVLYNSLYESTKKLIYELIKINPKYFHELYGIVIADGARGMTIEIAQRVEIDYLMLVKHETEGEAQRIAAETARRTVIEQQNARSHINLYEFTPQPRPHIPHMNAFVTDVIKKLKISNDLDEAVNLISDLISADIVKLLEKYVDNIEYAKDAKDTTLCYVKLTLNMAFIDDLELIIIILENANTTITDTFDNVLKVFGLTLVSVECVIPNESNRYWEEKINQTAQFIIDQKMFVSSKPTLKISVAFDAAAPAFEKARAAAAAAAAAKTTAKAKVAAIKEAKAAAAAAAEAAINPTYVFLHDVQTKTKRNPKDPQKIQTINEDIVAILNSYVDEIQYKVVDNLCSVKLSLNMNFIHKLGIIFERLNNAKTTITHTFEIVLQVFGLTLVSVQCVIPEYSNSNIISPSQIVEFAQFIIDQQMFVEPDPKLKISKEIQKIYDAAFERQHEYQLVVGGKKKKKPIKKKVKSRKYSYRKRKRSTRKR
jgi:hypothetical protein